MKVDEKKVRKAFDEWHKDSPNVMSPILKGKTVVESLDGVPVVIELSKERPRRQPAKYAVAVLVMCDADYRPVKEFSAKFTSISTRYDAFTEMTGLYGSRADASEAITDLEDLIKNLRIMDGVFDREE